MNFFKDLFFLNFKDYENINIEFPIGIFMIVLTVALSVLLFVLNYKKIIMTTMLKRCIRLGATEEGKAKTLAELALTDSRALKSALSSGGQLTYMVKRAPDASVDTDGAESSEAPQKISKIDFETAKFYISPDRLDRAKRVIETESTSWWQPAILTTVLFAILILFGIYADEILTLLDTYLKPKG